MYGAGESPGRLQNQVGRSLIAIREAVASEDAFLVANHLRLLVAVSAPKLKPEELSRFRIPEVVGGRDRHGVEARKLFGKCMDILADLLTVLSERGVYAYNEGELGDASGLALGAIGDGDDSETVRLVPDQ